MFNNFLCACVILPVPPEKLTLETDIEERKNYIGDVVQLVCTTDSALPARTIWWERDNSPILCDGTGSLKCDIKQEYNDSLYDAKLTISTLTITVQEEDDGIYACRVEGRTGILKQHAILVVPVGKIN